MEIEYIRSIRYHQLRLNVEKKIVPPFNLSYTCLFDINFKNKTMIQDIELSFDEKGNLCFSFPILQLDWRDEFLKIIHYKLPKLSKRVYDIIINKNKELNDISGNIGQREIYSIKES